MFIRPIRLYKHNCFYFSYSLCSSHDSQKSSTGFTVCNRFFYLLRLQCLRSLSGEVVQNIAETGCAGLDWAGTVPSGNHSLLVASHMIHRNKSPSVNLPITQSNGRKIVFRNILSNGLMISFLR